MRRLAIHKSNHRVKTQQSDGKITLTGMGTRIAEEVKNNGLYDSNLNLHGAQLCLFGQPILDIPNRSVVGLEVLLRIKKSDEFMLPGPYLESARHQCSIHKIDEWVFRDLLRILNSNRDLFTDKFVIAINLATETLNNYASLRAIHNLMACNPVNPFELVVEISEQTQITDFDNVNSALQSLRKVGCSIALDDFGKDFSFYDYLRKLDIDIIKIDGGYIANLDKSSIDKMIVKSIVSLAGNMKILTIAEHVENKESLRILEDFGVDQAQGFLIGKPEPLERLLQHFSANQTDAQVPSIRPS